MIEPGTVGLTAASKADSELLSNLLELYIHDLSPIFPFLQLGPDGRFGYPRLPQYWADPEQRHAYFITVDGAIAGFALVTHESPASDEPPVFDVAEYFVLQRYRRAGVGVRAATQIWQRYSGPWTVRVSEGHPAGVAFWRKATETFAPGAVKETSLPGEFHPWRVFTFASPGQDAAGS